MKFVVCFSGGHSSALAAIETVRREGKESVILLNHDISSHVEHQDIKRFKREVADYLELPITYADAPDFEQRTPLEVCKARSGFSAGTQQAFCTYELKTRPFYKWLDENLPSTPNHHIAYGFDADEEERISRRRLMIRSMGYTPEFPLAEWPRTIASTEEIGIPRPATYHLFKHANCIGCLKAGKQHWYAVYCIRPDIWQEAKEAEAQIGYSIIKGSFLKDLEQQFQHMKEDLKICPGDKAEPGAWWAMVERAFPVEERLIPCDCSF